MDKEINLNVVCKHIEIAKSKGLQLTGRMKTSLQMGCKRNDFYLEVAFKCRHKEFILPRVIGAKGKYSCAVLNMCSDCTRVYSMRSLYLRGLISSVINVKDLKQIREELGVDNISEIKSIQKEGDNKARRYIFGTCKCGGDIITDLSTFRATQKRRIAEHNDPELSCLRCNRFQGYARYKHVKKILKYDMKQLMEGTDGNTNS